MGTGELERHTAYWRYFFIKTEILPTLEGEITRSLYKAKGYNCFGKLIIDTTVPVWGKEKLSTSGFVDVRSLHARSLGCCPPALTKDFTQTEGTAMAERDPVLEAMKLHKRGYFGGGG